MPFLSMHCICNFFLIEQVPSMSVKVGQSALEGRASYASAIPDSPKFSSADYVSSSSHVYGQKGDQLYGEKVPDYPIIDRRQYGERQSSYMGRDLQNESTGRYAESVGYVTQHQVLCSYIVIFSFFFWFFFSLVYYILFY